MMDADLARELFDDAVDGQLSEAQQRDFEAALQADPELREDFVLHTEVVQAARDLSHEELNVDLLPGFQQRLRERSGGRFYRDRFATQTPRVGLLWAAACGIVLACAVLWWTVHQGWWMPPPVR